MTSIPPCDLRFAATHNIYEICKESYDNMFYYHLALAVLEGKPIVPPYLPLRGNETMDELRTREILVIFHEEVMKFIKTEERHPDKDERAKLNKLANLKYYSRLS